MNLNFHLNNTIKNFLGGFFIPVLCAAIILCGASKAVAQNVGINGTGAAPNNSAMLDVTSTNKGILIPQVALTGATDATSITTGNVNSLMVYNTATAGAGTNAITPGYYYWNTAAGRWLQMLAGSGNTGNVMFTGFQVFSASGTFTLPAGVTKVMIEMWGGGGGGGGSAPLGGTNGYYAGMGGGAGGYGKGLFNVTANITVTIGAGGAAGAANGNGGAGGATSVSGGAAMTANGGAGGAKYNGANTIAAGGTGPAIAASVLGIAGSPGALSTDYGGSGTGGTAPCGGPGGPGTSAPGAAGVVPGGGGGGAAADMTANRTGGAGGAGMVIIWW